MTTLVIPITLMYEDQYGKEVGLVICQNIATRMISNAQTSNTTNTGLQTRIKALMSLPNIQIKNAIEHAGATHTENPMALPSEEIKARLRVLGFKN